MNPIQRYILMGGGAIVVALALYVPWVHVLNTDTIHREKPAGYAPIFAPPATEKDHHAFGVRIDWARVVIPMVAAVIATAVGVLLTWKRRSPHQELKTT